ncbi:hypothetical protein Back11_39230 [Paenibacillus baekrokdamisoli]|uniref:Uncharacterized protein n=1 Tax=Paenibacillus baekrokdamisoli TaxID=1712516 RepID=A0A3G9JEY6_9BACL|nr:alanine--tRNA ligase-related protein [Paenibacillus baekrokdamisoli]MBB3068377.1 alanyl-tRNA synthetase [Paenibacillus baekrokdamisoli]BBH22578.1 hypothetical protein Back11_39230 [Paenibacillus baekrokdamisoli]
MIIEVEEIVLKFTNYYKSLNYSILDDDSIITDDPTLLFINSTIARVKEEIQVGENLDSTAIVQQCFRNNMTDYMMFTMLGVASLATEANRVMKDWINFIKEVGNIPEDNLFAVIHSQDGMLIDLWKKTISRPYYTLDQNTDKYTVRWKYGECYDFYGVGMSLAYIHPNRPKCNDSCDFFCDCDRHLALGNFIIINNPIINKQYIDIGFGVERLLSYKNGIDYFNFESNKKNLLGVISLGLNKEDAKYILSFMKGIKKLVEEGIVPGNKKQGYILKSLIKKIVINIAKYNKSSLFDDITKVLVMQDPSYKLYINDIQCYLQKYYNNYKKNIDSAKKFLKVNSGMGSTELMYILQDRFGVPYNIVMDADNTITYK